MMKFAICLLALAACGLPDKTHCATSNDCLDGDVCRAGACNPPIDGECGTTAKVCGMNASCTDSGGGLACSCNAGFDGDGVTCSDLNECAAKPSPCADHAACANSPGAFSCACESGFTGDGSTYCAPAQFTKVATADGMSCGVASDSTMWCWGVNMHGGLGDGTLAPHAHPVQVSHATDQPGVSPGWIDVDARDGMACGRRTDHSMYCWGLGSDGQLGNGESKNSLTPVFVPTDKPGIGWKMIATGRRTVCGLHDDGGIACWGFTPEFDENLPFALPIAGMATDWTAVAVGTVRCFLKGSPGKLFCMGESSNGDLGLGSKTSVIVPEQIGTDLWKTVAVGSYNACAIRADGALFCWGNNPLLPIALQYGNVPKQIGTATDWEAISISMTGILGLRGGGHAYGWGGNSQGELGLPIKRDVLDPTPITGDVAVWNQISAGNVHSCGLSAGQVYCWGTVNDGFLGTGATTTLTAPTKISGDSWTSLAGDYGRSCGVRGDGALVCRGYDAALGVGFGDTEPVWAPTRIGSDTWTAVSGSGSILESQVMCGIRGGAPYCWGNNTTGELGIGNTTNQLRPTAVKMPPGAQWTEIAPGDHSCAISSEGLMYCWGANDTGQLGTGFPGGPFTTPSNPVPGTWLHVAVARYGLPGALTCGIKANHTLWCWGQDQPPSIVEHDAPTQIGIDDNWAAISAGAPRNTVTNRAGTICAIRSTGTLWCWGTELGNGTHDSSPAPLQVGADTDWKAVTVGREICAIKTGGSLWCWANSELLGDGAPANYDSDAGAATRPIRIGGDTDWATVTTTGRTCGTKTDGSQWCWGYGAAATPDIITVPQPIR